MKGKSHRLPLVVAGFALLIVFLVGGAAASVFAYRQFAEKDTLDLSFSVLGRQADEGLDEIVERGVLVTHVDPESPAAAAGLRRGSIILEINGMPVNSPQELKDAIRGYEVGENISLSVQDGDEVEEMTATLASLGPYLGVNVAGSMKNNGFHFEAEPEFRHHHHLPESPHFDGLPFGHPEIFPDMPEILGHSPLVTFVAAGSPAEEAGIQVGDVITEINDEMIDSRQQLVDVIGTKQPGDSVKLMVQRKDESLTISARLGEHPEIEERAYLGVQLGIVGFQRQFILPDRLPRGSQS